MQGSVMMHVWGVNERPELEFRVQHSEALPGGQRWTLWLTICGVPSALGRETEVKTTDWFHHSKQTSKQLKHNNSELWFGDMLQTLEWTGSFELNPTDCPISWKLLKQFVSVRGRPERLTETQYKHTSHVLWEWSQTKIKMLKCSYRTTANCRYSRSSENADRKE